MEGIQRLRRVLTTVLLLGGAGWFLLAPAAIVLCVVEDPALRGQGNLAWAYRWHRNLTPRFEAWARGRVATRRATPSDPRDVSGSEWPMFGTVFYLLATESLQDGRDGAPASPMSYAGGAVEAAASLLVDPANAEWVRARWGDDYLHHENIFYRHLLIFGLVAYERLTGDLRHRALLEDQVETLSAELAAAPHRLLDDYPGECYPTDVVWAVAAIRRADAVLGTDHRALANDLLGHLQGSLLDPLGLPPYLADSRGGTAIGGSRGCSNSGLLIMLPELDADLARRWFDLYEKHFWQRRGLFDGFREFPPGEVGRGDVDSGPVILGHGVAACAFGAGAARANGRWARHRTLSAESVLFAWPLPDGQLLVPRLLSNATEAPLLGESGVLFSLTRPGPRGAAEFPAEGLSPLFWILWCSWVLLGLTVVWGEARRWRRWRKEGRAASPGRARGAFFTWAVLLTAASILAVLGLTPIGAIAALLAFVVPERLAGRSATCPGTSTS